MLLRDVVGSNKNPRSTWSSFLLNPHSCYLNALQYIVLEQHKHIPFISIYQDLPDFTRDISPEFLLPKLPWESQLPSDNFIQQTGASAFLIFNSHFTQWYPHLYLPLAQNHSFFIGHCFHNQSPEVASDDLSQFSIEAMVLWVRWCSMIFLLVRSS
jgi:hypothetical protein